MQTREAMAREDDKRLPATEQSENHDLVGQYLTQIGSTPLLDAQQEVDLAKRIEVGVYAANLIERADAENTELPHDRRELEWLAQDGQDAKDHMIRANLRLVVSAARKYHRHSGMAFLDVVQEGNLGLIRAVEKFDYMKGYKFSTYAMWWIRQSIDRGKVDQARTIRLPAHMVEKVSKVARSERKLQLRLDRDPTVHEVAEEADISVEQVEMLREVSRNVASLDSPVGDDGSTNVGDLVEDMDIPQAHDVVEYQALGQELRSMVETLPAREAKLIMLRYGLRDGRSHTLQEVAERLGLTRERVRQLEKESIATLRDPQRHQPVLDWAS